jgi:hypothetical protein
MEKPNGVLFKNDSGRLIVCLINPDGVFDWENVLLLKDMPDKFDDLSIEDPFEFVFIIWDDESMTMTTFDQKSVVQHYSFTKLYEDGILKSTIELDYKRQFTT